MTEEWFGKHAAVAAAHCSPPCSLDLIHVVTTGCCSEELVRKYHSYRAVC